MWIELRSHLASLATPQPNKGPSALSVRILTFRSEPSLFELVVSQAWNPATDLSVLGKSGL